VWTIDLWLSIFLGNFWWRLTYQRLVFMLHLFILWSGSLLRVWYEIEGNVYHYESKNVDKQQTLVIIVKWNTSDGTIKENNTWTELEEPSPFRKSLLSSFGTNDERRTWEGFLKWWTVFHNQLSLYCTSKLYIFNHSFTIIRSSIVSVVLFSVSVFC